MKNAVDFTHAILTRFNVARPKLQDPIRLDPRWLAERFDLFERYCLPSMAAQTSRDFRWIVYFDTDTPSQFHDRIEACRAVFPFTAYFTPVIDAPGWPRSLRESLGDPTPWLLTTRFDNDDALAADYVGRLQAAVSDQPPQRGSFNFTHGLIREGRRVYALAHPSNAFGSWLEPWDDATRTAISIHHMKMAQHGPVSQIGGPAAWLQVVHGGNISNKVRGRRVNPAWVQDRFPPALMRGLEEPSRSEVLLDSLLLGPLRNGRDAALARFRRHA